ncbi:hypothetical protein D9M68_254200 [compost metagenome]
MNFYAIQTETLGVTIWRFDSKRERDAFVEGGRFRRNLAARDVDAAFRAPGQYTRWGKR